MDKQKDKFYVYIHRALDSNQVYYVGKGSGTRAFDLNKRSKYHRGVIKKYGCIVEIVIEHLTHERALIQEILGIKYYHPRCNFTKGGEGVQGYERTQQDKDNISFRMKGDKNHRFGKVGTMKGKKQSSIAMDKLQTLVYGKRKGKTHIEIYGKEKAEEIRLKSLNHEAWNSGVSWSSKMRDKLSLAHGGKVILVFLKINNHLIDEVFNMSKCAEKYGVGKSVIQRYLTGRNQFHKKNKCLYWFKYKE
jgi:hypothetical protein